MNKACVIAVLIAGCLICSGMSAAAGPGQADRQAALDSLIAAERAFSRTSEEKGIREAFLTWLAPDSVVFRPGPVEGRPVYEKMDPENPAVLTWEPEVAEVSAAGDLGYTSGPYVLRPRRGAEPSAFGHYVSVWQKQPDGTWKVFLDIGIRHDRPASPISAIEPASPRPQGNPLSPSPEAFRDESQALGKLAGSFESAVGARGYRKALLEFASDDIRVYRPGRFPTGGKSLVRTIIPRSAGLVKPGQKQRRARYEVRMSGSGDLAFTYGTSDYVRSPTTVEATAYLKIWRKDASGIWKICLDIEVPVPPEGKRAG